jgi:hypothetical protein
MEHLFSPCTRLHDILESRGGLGPRRIQEQNLDVSTEELLSAERAFTFADLYFMLGDQNTVAWLSSHAAIMRADGIADRCCHHVNPEGYSSRFDIDGKIMVVVTRSSEAFSEIVDVVCRLLVANSSDVYNLKLWKQGRSDELPINATSLASSIFGRKSVPCAWHPFQARSRDRTDLL